MKITRKPVRDISIFWTGFLLMAITLICPQAEAGVALGATRVIYPAGNKQVQLAVTNNDDKSTYLIQSWIENAAGAKAGNFVVTPPLFAMKGKKENSLRIIDATNKQLANDRETLFWMNVKAIPAMDKEKAGENSLQLAIVSRIKMFYRPQNLAMPPEEAQAKIVFSRKGSSLVLVNPTPYYLTVTELNMGKHNLGNAFVPPQGEASVKLPSNAAGDITYRTINDYGALTPVMKGITQ